MQLIAFVGMYYMYLMLGIISKQVQNKVLLLLTVTCILKWIYWIYLSVLCQNPVTNNNIALLGDCNGVTTLMLK